MLYLLFLLMINPKVQKKFFLPTTHLRFMRLNLPHALQSMSVFKKKKSSSYMDQSCRALMATVIYESMESTSRKIMF